MQCKGQQVLCYELSGAQDGNFSHSYASSLSWLCAEENFCKRGGSGCKI